jgi:hypothetical protein
VSGGAQLPRQRRGPRAVVIDHQHPLRRHAGKVPRPLSDVRVPEYVLACPFQT